MAPGERALAFLRAGGDMIIAKTIPSAAAMYKAIVSRATTDKSFEALVNGAASKVLTSKQAAGLLPCR